MILREINLMFGLGLNQGQFDLNQAQFDSERTQFDCEQNQFDSTQINLSSLPVFGIAFLVCWGPLFFVCSLIPCSVCCRPHCCLCSLFLLCFLFRFRFTCFRFGFVVVFVLFAAFFHSFILVYPFGLFGFVSYFIIALLSV